MEENAIVRTVFRADNFNAKQDSNNKMIDTTLMVAFQEPTSVAAERREPFLLQRSRKRCVEPIFQEENIIANPRRATNDRSCCFHRRSI